METSLRPADTLVNTLESISNLASAKVPDSVAKAIDWLTKPVKLNTHEINFDEVNSLPPASVTVL